MAALLQAKIQEVKWYANKQQRHQRWTAIECWFACRQIKPSQQRISEASRLFKQLNPGCTIKQVARHIQYWRAHLWRRGTLSNTTSAGPTCQLPDEAAQEAVEVLYQGYVSEGRQLAFTSIGEAIALSPRLQAILAQYQVQPETLRRRMKEVHPEVRRRLQRAKRLLTPELKADRLRDCTHLLLHWPLSKLRRVFWMDATTIIIKPRGMKVYLPPGHPHLVISDDRFPTHSSHIQKMKFYICINAILGPVGIEFISGTTDLEPAGNWVVSCSQPQCWQVACCSGCLPLHVSRFHPAAFGIRSRVVHKTAVWLLLHTLDGCPCMLAPAACIIIMQAQQPPAAGQHKPVQLAVSVIL
jgi:hypothetical protein